MDDQPKTPARGEPTDAATFLKGLYAEEIARGGDIYMEHHGKESVVRRHVDVFERYLPALPAEGKFLDWGCHHGPDSALVRHALGPGVELYGCDFAEPGIAPVFHSYTGLDYTQLTSPIELPYEDDTFDVIIGGGVLEHTANDSTALSELHRVLKDGGLLVITFLPNKWSYTEFLGGLVTDLKHLRLYGRGEIRRLLLHHGFLPEMIAYHQIVPTSRPRFLASRIWWLNAALERIWPLNRLSTNLMAISRRRNTM